MSGSKILVLGSFEYPGPAVRKQRAVMHTSAGAGGELGGGGWQAVTPAMGELGERKAMKLQPQTTPSPCPRFHFILKFHAVTFDQPHFSQQAYQSLLIGE